MTPHVTSSPLVRRLLLVCVALAMLIVPGAGCTEARLEPIPPEPVYRDDKLAVSGSFCTREPETLIFPLRVLFVIDASVSMEVTDPPDPVTGEAGRQRAVRETYETLLDQGPEGVRVGVLRFSAQARSRTAVDLDGDSLPDTYFTADRDLLAAATDALGVTDRTTNYANALGEAYFQLRTEYLAADQESLPLSKYVVVFLSDGVPDVDAGGGRGNSFDQIEESVLALRELADTFRVGDFAFHTAYIATGRESSDSASRELLQRMADAGGGTFRDFPNGEELNFLFVDFTILRRLFTVKTLSAVNTNVTFDKAQIQLAPQPPNPLADAGADAGLDFGFPDVGGADAGADVGAPSGPTEPPAPNPNMFVDLNQSNYIDCGEPLVDSDGDGLADFAELAIGTDPLVPDTDDDGLNDFLEWDLSRDGLNPLDPEDSQCFIANPCVDEDNDGLCDCVLDQDSDGLCDCADFDNNNDGIPDDQEAGGGPLFTIPRTACADNLGRDCVDLDEDGRCDCPDVDFDGLCDYDDRDADGLNDCEEVFYGSAQNGNDSDADGLPDLSEVRFRMNPAKEDLLEDLDSDRTLNGTEALANTPPGCNDSEFRSRTAYRYELDQLPVDGARSCYEFDISNITLVPTVADPRDAARYPGNGWNRILLYAGEVAFDDPGAFARYRVACVMARYNPDGNYKNPPSGRMRLEELDFVEVADFDPDRDCKIP